MEGKSQVEMINILESTVNMITNNINKAMDSLAPIKVMNQRREREPWREDPDIQWQWNKENMLWNQYKSSPSGFNKMLWREERSRSKKLIREKK